MELDYPHAMPTLKTNQGVTDTLSEPRFARSWGTLKNEILLCLQEFENLVKL
jgi:hypothetical protein